MNRWSSPQTSLPSYETMIVESLQNVGGTHGAAPKEIFNYMAEHWPLIPNFRPSASQALARAFKRGRLLKEGSLYSLNTAWTSEHTTPDPMQPTRHIAKMPASILNPRPLPPVEYEADLSVPEAPSDSVPFSPDTKAIAQAIVSLLRPMIGDIKGLAGTRVDNVGEELSESGNDHRSLRNSTTGLDGMSTDPSSLEYQCMASSSERNRSQAGWLSEIIPVDVSERTTDEVRQGLLKSLESLSAHLRTIHTQ